MSIESMILEQQRQLLRAVRASFALEGQELSSRVEDAAMAVPRHAFVQRYRYWNSTDWEMVDADNLVAHLPALYRDDGLGIAGLEGDEQLATISRPTVVLTMLELLDIQPGHRVFEVGAGSGWNAGLMGHLAGPQGSVESAEIIPELASQAEGVIRRLGLDQVRILSGDASALAQGRSGFDRVVFTAGSYDIPKSVFDCVRVGGRLLMVLKFPGGGDVVILFRREEAYFESITARPYEFVTMTGAGFRRELEPIQLEDFEPWALVGDRPVRERPFACGGLDRAGLAGRTHALRTFLTIREKRMVWFVEPEGWPYFFFGLWDESSQSLALVRNLGLTSYGGDEATQALLGHLHTWVDLGLPSAVTMKVRAYRPGEAPELASDQCLLRRPETDFVWSLSEVNAPEPGPA